jgi:hypothetical protein
LIFRSGAPVTSGKSCKHPESQGDDDVMNLSPNESSEKGEACFVEALESEIAREDEESLPSGLREKMSHFHQDCERNVARLPWLEGGRGRPSGRGALQGDDCYGAVLGVIAGDGGLQQELADRT